MTDGIATIHVEVTRPEEATLTVANFAIDEHAQRWLQTEFSKDFWGDISMQFADDGTRAVFGFRDGKDWWTYKANILYGLVYANATLCDREVEVVENFNLELSHRMRGPTEPKKH
ncbi:MAG: hypothetical protein JWO07_238 [Candidatus Saccharibacteria bacterium]|nr:hypothetical protein [Candidatus Saccharibacteria bacterium]